MKLFRWVEGRQNSGYWKLPLIFSSRFKLDMYVLAFNDGVSVPWHKDPANDGKHYRLNIYLRRPGGGDLELKGPAIFNNRYFHLFRPDTVEHSMTKVEGGTLYMLSIGKVL